MVWCKIPDQVTSYLRIGTSTALSGVVANNASRDALSNAEHNEITRTSNNTERTIHESLIGMPRNSRLNNIEQEFNYIEEYSYRPERIPPSPYNINNYDEFDQHGIEPIYTRSQMPIQNIPVTNANAQQYSNDPRLLSEVEQLRATVTNLEQKLASHQLLPPKAPTHTSFLKYTKPRDFGIYYLIHYFSTKLSKDKQKEPKDFSTCQPLSKELPWDMLMLALQAVPNIFQPAELYRKADRDFIHKGKLDFASAYPNKRLRHTATSGTGNIQQRIRSSQQKNTYN